jgi:hypothetical protein
MEAMEAPSIDEVRESTTSKEILVRTSRRSGDGGHSCLHHRGGATCFRKVKMHNNEEMAKFDTHTHTHERQREPEKTKIMVRLYAFTKKCMSCDTRAHYY